MRDIEIKLMQCPKCKTKKKLSVATGERIRNTWCHECSAPVTWTEIEVDE